VIATPLKKRLRLLVAVGVVGVVAALAPATITQ